MKSVICGVILLLIGAAVSGYWYWTRDRRQVENLLYEIDILIRNLEDYKEAVARNDTSRLSGIIKTGRILKERDIIVNGDEKPHKFG
jgi:hypothetical protein